MPSLTVGDHELHYLRRGEGPPMLLIQGLGGHHLHWGDAFLEDLEADFALTVFDNRGIGRSSRLRGAFTIADLAADAAAVLHEVVGEPAHVLGISMGGMIAQELALAEPGALLSLTLGCSYPGGPGSVLTAPDVAQAMGEAIMSGDRERAIRAIWEANVSAAFADDDGAYAAFRRTALELPSPLQVQVAQVQAIARHDVQARLGSITAPTLLVHGDEDRILPVQNSRILARAIPDARLEVLEGAGHLFWIERPDRSAALVREHARTAAAAARE